jgi:hypothetical protein
VRAKTFVRGATREGVATTMASRRDEERRSFAAERWPSGPDRIDYRFTIEDPSTYTRPWTASLPMQGLPDYVIVEYACHEGNYSIRNVLSGARAQQR